MKVQMKAHAWGYKSVTLNVSWETCSCTIFAWKTKIFTLFFSSKQLLQNSVFAMFWDKDVTKNNQNWFCFCSNKSPVSLCHFIIHLCSFCSFSDALLGFFLLSCWKFVCSFFFQLRNLLTFSLCSFFFSFWRFCFYFCSLVSFLCFLFSFHSAV